MDFYNPSVILVSRMSLISSLGQKPGIFKVSISTKRTSNPIKLLKIESSITFLNVTSVVITIFFIIFFFFCRIDDWRDFLHLWSCEAPVIFVQWNIAKVYASTFASNFQVLFGSYKRKEILICISQLLMLCCQLTEYTDTISRGKTPNMEWGIFYAT